MRRIILTAIACLAVLAVGSPTAAASTPTLVTPGPYVHGQTITVDVGSAKYARLVCDEADGTLTANFSGVVDGFVTFVLADEITWTSGDAWCVVEVGSFKGGTRTWNPRNETNRFFVDDPSIFI